MCNSLLLKLQACKIRWGDLLQEGFTPTTFEGFREGSEGSEGRGGREESAGGERGREGNEGGMGTSNESNEGKGGEGRGGEGNEARVFQKRVDIVVSLTRSPSRTLGFERGNKPFDPHPSHGRPPTPHPHDL